MKQESFDMFLECCLATTITICWLRLNLGLINVKTHIIKIKIHVWCRLVHIYQKTNVP